MTKEDIMVDNEDMDVDTGDCQKNGRIIIAEIILNEYWFWLNVAQIKHLFLCVVVYTLRWLVGAPTNFKVSIIIHGLHIDSRSRDYRITSGFGGDMYFKAPWFDQECLVSAQK